MTELSSVKKESIYIYIYARTWTISEQMSGDEWLFPLEGDEVSGDRV
jgi:hypothetical protein